MAGSFFDTSNGFLGFILSVSGTDNIIWLQYPISSVFKSKTPYYWLTNLQITKFVPSTKHVLIFTGTRYNFYPMYQMVIINAILSRLLWVYIYHFPFCTHKFCVIQLVWEIKMQNKSIFLKTTNSDLLLS